MAKYVNGGYPQGYIKTGKELGLFPMNIDAQEVAIKEHLFVLVYNILKTPILFKTDLQTLLLSMLPRMIS